MSGDYETLNINQPEISYMSHQSTKMKAHRVIFEPEPEKKQPEDFLKLEDVPTYKEPEGEPSF